MGCCRCYVFFFFNDTATTEIYTLSLHDALPIYSGLEATTTSPILLFDSVSRPAPVNMEWNKTEGKRSEEHTSELQSRLHLVCRLLLEKKKKSTRSAYLDTIHYNFTPHPPSQSYA